MSDDKPKIAVLFHTWVYCGDHAADVCRVIDLRPSETVEALVARIGLGNKQGERIELRVVEVLP